MMIASEASARWTSASVIPPTVACQYANLDLGMLQLREFLANGLDRTADVRPEDDVQRLDLLALAQPLEEVFQGYVRRAAAERLLARFLRTLFGDFAGLGDFGHDVEPGARARRRVQARQIHRRRWPGLLVSLPRVERVIHRLDPAERRTANDDVADAQGSALDEHFGDDAASFVQF